MALCFFCLDLDSAQPLCFTLASAARTVTQATPELLELSQEILNPDRIKPLWSEPTASITLPNYSITSTLIPLLNCLCRCRRKTRPTRIRL